MELRRLGTSSLEVSPLAFGGNVFGFTLDEPRSFEVLDAFVAAGGNFIDTADVYFRWKPGNQGGESETILGRWMKVRGNRGRVVIATKVGMEMGPEAKGLSRRYIMKAVEDSLTRLQTDYIDLYQSHEDDLATPIEETLDTYALLIKQGKVRAIGASNFSVERLQAALDLSAARGLPAYASLQPQYNLMERSAFEGALQTLCVQRGLAVIPYFPLASGFLTGKYRSQDDVARSARGMFVGKYLDDRGMRVLAALDAASAALGAEPATTALAWLLAKPAVTAPIVSATSVTQVQATMKAATLRLPPDIVAALDRTSQP